MYRKNGFSLVELMVVIIFVGILAATLIPLISKHSTTEVPIQTKEYKIAVNDYIKDDIYIGYQGMLSPSTFVMSHCPTCDNPHIVYYPIGIDTLFEGKHAFIIKEVAPKYIILKALY